MTHEELTNELDECRRLACACRGECKQQPEVFYLVGCTIIFCDCVKLAVGDWHPREAMRIWNGAWQKTKLNFDQQLLDAEYQAWIRKQWLENKFDRDKESE